MRHRSRTISLYALLAAVVLFGATGPVFGQTSRNGSPLPKPTGHVNDYAGVIDAGTKGRLEDRLRNFKTDSGVEIAVAVVRTTGSRDIFDYSLAVARGWGIGSTADDNPGALLFIAIDDRKYFTHVSKDLEDELPDGVVGSLQRSYLVPEFKKGNYAKGINDTVEAYIQTYQSHHDGTTPPPAITDTGSDGETSWFSVFCCLAIILFVVLLISANNRQNRGKSKDDHDRWGGGGFGGGGGGILPWIILGGSGSSSGSSSWDSGGSDWGGFGGGGDFGGGGAGGGW